MKYLHFFCLFCVISCPWALAIDDFQLTKCLGQEEKLIHEAKERGPTYQINQMLISIFVTMPTLNIKQEFFKKICSPVRIGTSLELLDLIFRHYEGLFGWNDASKVIQPNNDTLEELFRRLPELFNQFMLEIKATAPTSDCLENNIEELKNFQMELQYLGQDILFRTIAQKNKQLVKILDALKNKDALFAKCESELKEKSKK